MQPQQRRWSRRQLFTAAGAATVASAATGVFGLPQAAHAATVISSVDTSRTTFDKLTLMADGKPFYHSGIQFRYEKHKYSYGWTDAQLKPALRMIAEDGYNVVNIPLWWSKLETSKDVFSYADVDRYVDWCAEYGLKLEILWFSHESTGLTMPYRLPSYALNEFQYVVRQDGSELRKRGTGEPDEPPQGFGLLDKTDPRLLDREKLVLSRLMSHLATYDTDHTVVGVQLLNEPNVSGLWDVRIDRSYSSYSNELWRGGGYTSTAQFRKDVLLNFISGLGQTIKESDYSVYTRSNPKGDAGIAENEARRAQGRAYLDFWGYDPYNQDANYVYNYGQDAFWAQGRNFPMIMENHANIPNADVMKFNGVAGNAAYNVYAALDPDSDSGSSTHGFYSFNPSTKAISRTAIVAKVAAVNHMINKAAWDIASKLPVERGGSKLQTFNRTATASSTATKSLDGQSVTYATTAAGMGIAIKRSASEIAVLSSKTGTYTLPGGEIASVESGQYDGDNAWVRSGSKSYSTSGGNIVVNLNAVECVRVLYSGEPSEEGPVNGATYKLKNAATGQYLDTEADGVVVAAAATAYDDQNWVLAQQSNGSWTVKNARAGRNFLDTEAGNAVIWNDGFVGADSQWRIETAAGGFRLKNDRSDRGYLYADSTGRIRWNTGTADASTVWAFERQ